MLDFSLEQTEVWLQLGCEIAWQLVMEAAIEL
jgi:hypothetical protein